MIVERVGDGARVKRAWQGMLVVCLASGPSITREDIEILKEARARDAIRLIAVNDMYLVAPFADICYFADVKWHGWQREGLERSWSWAKFSATEVRQAFAEFRGQKVTIRHPMEGKPNNATGPDIFVLLNHGDKGLSEKDDGVHTGRNSGYQALNVAVLAGGNPIALVGYDMRFENGRSHSHNGHPAKDPEAAYHEYAKTFRSTEIQLKRLGVKVINCSADSKITAFPKQSLEEALRVVV